MAAIERGKKLAAEVPVADEKPKIVVEPEVIIAPEVVTPVPVKPAFEIPAEILAFLPPENPAVCVVESAMLETAPDPPPPTSKRNWGSVLKTSKENHSTRPVSALKKLSITVPLPIRTAPAVLPKKAETTDAEEAVSEPVSLS